MESNTHHETRPRQRARQTNVIPMEFDAAFFYERGVRFLQKNDLKKALKAFRKTVEFEPNNPINYCNLAGVLSELGDFQASNDVLMHVLNDIDPGMTECKFYLANNYANMGQYDIAEEHVIEYLDEDPEGEYAEDAEEMLSVLVGEFGGGKAYAKWEERRKEEELDAARYDGRHLLEEGHFEAAVEWLEEVLDREPNNTAARNNLSLACYYTGQYGRAVELAEHVLEKQPSNVHALCNLAVFSVQLGPKERLQACISHLKKVFPLHYDQAMKIGTTLGLIGEHADALRVFQKLAKMVEQPEPVLLHSLAAAAANTGHLGTARKWWRMLHDFPDMQEIASYYLGQLEQVRLLGKRIVRASYQCDLPLQVHFTNMKKRLQEGDIASWRKDSLLRASLYWGLRHGTIDTRRTVLRALAMIGDEEAAKALRVFLKRDDIDESLQAAALFALSRCDREGRVEVNRGGSLVSMTGRDIPEDVILGVDPGWLKVWEDVAAWLKTHRNGKWVEDAKRIWLSFLANAFVSYPFRLVKSELWVAGLIYTVLKRNEMVLTKKKDFATEFGVAPSSLSKVVSRLERFYQGTSEI